MADRDPNIIHSGLSVHKTIEGRSFKLCIYRLEQSPDWALEVELSDGGSVVWDGTFETDDAAYAEYERTLREEGLGAVLGTDAVVVPFPKR
jgi:hypothetical protein